MVVNYECLGKTAATRERRYKVLVFYLKGATPIEIAKLMGLKPKRISNDIYFIKNNAINNLPLNIVRDLGQSFFEQKITELERKLKENETDMRVWLGIQKLILEYKDRSLKMYGALFDGPETPGTIMVEANAKWLEDLPRAKITDAEFIEIPENTEDQTNEDGTTKGTD